LLRYKPDFVTSLFVINELYCIILSDWQKMKSQITFSQKLHIYKTIAKTIDNYYCVNMFSLESHHLVGLELTLFSYTC
jgi:hypothetical protein